MIDKIIGVLGGMGPEATVDCLAKIIANTPAKKDQDHLHVIIESNPKIPDRTEAILGHGRSPLSEIVKACQILETAGTDFIIIPCVTAHAFLDELKDKTSIPILSIFDVVTEMIKTDYSAVESVGLLATTGTIRSGLFQRRLAASNIKTVVPVKEMQAKVMSAIYDLKTTKPIQCRKDINKCLLLATGSLINAGAQGIIAGCTEIPLALSQKDLLVPYFDSISILAKAAVKEAMHLSSYNSLSMK